MDLSKEVEESSRQKWVNIIYPCLPLFSLYIMGVGLSMGNDVKQNILQCQLQKF